MDYQDSVGAGSAASVMAWLRLAGFVVLVVVLVPVLVLLRLARQPIAEAMPQFFHGLLVRLVGIRVRVRGSMIDARDGQGPILYVSNHSSYLDIPVLGAVIGAYFVAKSEVASWPFFGTMARLQNTVFIERRQGKAGAQRDILRATLEDGHSLILFPEGTSSDGMRTLPFKSSLLAITEQPLANGQFVRVQPVSALCTEINGMPIGRSWRPFYAWFGDMTLVKHVWRVFKIGHFTIDIIFHDPVKIDDFGSRKLLAAYCQAQIADGVDQCVTGRFKKELAGNA